MIFFVEATTSSAFLSPFQSDWHHEWSIMMSWDRFESILQRRGYSLLALSLWSIIFFLFFSYVNGIQLNEITTERGRNEPLSCKLQAVTNFEQKCRMNSLELIRVYHCHCPTCVGTLTLRGGAESLLQVWRGSLWKSEVGLNPLVWKRKKLYPLNHMKQKKKNLFSSY